MRTFLRFGTAGCLAATMLTALGTGGPAASADSTSGLRVLQVRESLLGKHTWWQQTYRGVDVANGLYAEHEYADGRTVVDDERKPVVRPVDVEPEISAAQAIEAAGGRATRTTLQVDAVSSRLVYTVLVVRGRGATQVLVDADTGEVVRRQHAARHEDGTGRVFEPNPVVTLQDTALEDAEDADLPSLAPAYRDVVLTHLDGSGFLSGDFAEVREPDGELAFSETLDFVYPRSSDLFSQVMAYHHISRSQEYLQQLGFDGAKRIIFHPQVVYPSAFEEDQSFFVPSTDEIYLGEGLVDDAEDADVIWHEYGHAIQDDQVPDFGLGRDARAIGEGFADFWAVTMSQPVNGGYDEPCFADWDAPPFLEPRCLTRVDRDLTIKDRNGEEHHDGQIWSRALWDINQALGRDATARLVVESQFAYGTDVSFAEGAEIIVDTAELLLGRTAARVVEEAFVDRGILGPVGPHEPADPPAGPGLHLVGALDVVAPGGGLMINVLEAYELNDGGDALFATDLTSGGQGLFLSRRGEVEEIVRTGQDNPAGGEFGLGPLARASLNNRAEAAFSFFPETFVRPFPVGLSLYRWRRATGVVPVVTPEVTRAPTGGVFHGTEDVDLDDDGVIAFAGAVDSAQGTHPELGVGVFLAWPDGEITSAAVPGDRVAGGGVLDYADSPSLNNVGDLAFGGHLAGTPCVASFPQTRTIGCERDLFVLSDGVVRRVVGAGDPAPGGGTFRRINDPVLNDAGDVVFRASVTRNGVLEGGVFLYRDGSVHAVARQGQAMPGGGAVRAVASFPVNWDVNDAGQVTFAVGLNIDDNDDGLFEQGIYEWADGVLRVRARSGQELANGSRIVALQPWAFLGGPAPVTGAQINDSGRVLLTAFVDGPEQFGVYLFVAGQGPALG